MAQPASFMSYALVDDSDGRLQQFRDGRQPDPLINGIAAVVLGVMVFNRWPSNSAWVLGMLYASIRSSGESRF